MAVAAAVVCCGGMAQAVPITGNIGFTGDATLNGTSVNSSTEVLSWNNTVVNGTSGSFASIADGTPVTFASPWFFNSSAIPAFWAAGGFTFALDSSSIAIDTAGFLNVSGSGMVSGNNYDPTALAWNFSTQNPDNGASSSTFTFSASANASGGGSVPDGGTTVMLLGMGLLGLGLVKKTVFA